MPNGLLRVEAEVFFSNIYRHKKRQTTRVDCSIQRDRQGDVSMPERDNRRRRRSNFTYCCANCLSRRYTPKKPRAASHSESSARELCVRLTHDFLSAYQRLFAARRRFPRTMSESARCSGSDSGEHDIDPCLSLARCASSRDLKWRASQSVSDRSARRASRKSAESAANIVSEIIERQLLTAKWAR